MNSVPTSKGIAPVRILVLLTGFLGAGKTTFLQNLDQAALAARPDACLLTDAEMKLAEAGWRKFSDPFLEWRVAEAAPENSPTEIRA